MTIISLSKPPPLTTRSHFRGENLTRAFGEDRAALFIAWPSSRYLGARYSRIWGDHPVDAESL